jgi:hypothetical protein
MQSDPYQEDLYFAKDGKRITGREFINMLHQMKSGMFEKIDKTYAPDDDLCDVAIVKNGDIKFYEQL